MLQLLRRWKVIDTLSRRLTLFSLSLLPQNTRDAVRQFKLPLESSTTFEEFLASVRAWEQKLEQMEVRDEREHSLLVKEYNALRTLAMERSKNLRLAFEEIKADVSALAIACRCRCAAVARE